MSTGPDPAGVLGVIAEDWEGVRGADLLRRALPREDVVVITDQAFAPYARRRPERVRERTAWLIDEVVDEGAKAVLLAGGFASFVTRPEPVDLPVRGLERGLVEALRIARGRPVAAVYATADVPTMALAHAIRDLRGGGSVTLVERGSRDPGALVARIRETTPDVAVVCLVTPRAFADVDGVRAAADGIPVVDALEAAVSRLVEDVRRRRLLARHGLRRGRISVRATRGATTANRRSPLPPGTAVSLRRR